MSQVARTSSSGYPTRKEVSYTQGVISYTQGVISYTQGVISYTQGVILHARKSAIYSDEETRIGSLSYTQGSRLMHIAQCALHAHCIG